MDLFLSNKCLVCPQAAVVLALGLVKRYLSTKLSTAAVHNGQKRLQNRRLSNYLKNYFKFVGQYAQLVAGKSQGFFGSQDLTNALRLIRKPGLMHIKGMTHLHKPSKQIFFPC